MPVRDDCKLCKKYGRACHYHDETKGVDPKDCKRCKQLGRPCHYHAVDESTDRGDGRGPEAPGLCNAWLSKRGRRCRNEAGKRTDHRGVGHCWLHGGNRKMELQKAKRESAEEAVAKFARPIDVGPRDALIMSVQAYAGIVAFLSDRVAEMGQEDLVWGVTREEVSTGGDSPGTRTVKEAKPSVWYLMLAEARRDLVSAATNAARAGVEERVVKVAEEHAQLFAAAIRGMLSDLGHDPTRPEVVAVVRRHLLAVGNQRPSQFQDSLKAGSHS